MMLKNEEKTVQRTIESVLSVVDDVVIGIDNATTDNTLKVVQAALGTKNRSFHYFDFKDDFSEIRNSLIEKANHEWILILDGHEYVHPDSLMFFEELKNTDVGDTEIFDINVSQEDKGTTVFTQPRLFKSHIRYDLPIHNVIIQTEKRVLLAQVKIIHDQPLERLQARKEQRKGMNIAGLKGKAMDGDTRSMYYLANTYFEMDDFKNAKKWLLKYIPKSGFQHERYEARIQLAIIYLKDGSLEPAEKALLGCFKDNVVLNEHLILLGDIAYKRKQYNQAVSYYRSASSFKLPDFFLILKEEAYTWLPWYKMAQCAMQNSDVALLKESIRKGKQFAPDREEFFAMDEKLQEKLAAANLPKKKGNIYVVASLPIFIEPFLKEFDKTYNIMFETKFSPDTAERADVIFCDWLDHNAIAVSHSENKAKKIIRVHAYEVFNDFFLNRVDFNNIDELIFVAPHIQDYFNTKTHGWDLKNKQQVVTNGVDLDKFVIAPGKRDNMNGDISVAWSGFITNKKGAVLLLAVAEELKGLDFHVCGTFQEQDIADLFQRNKPDNLTLYPWQDDLNTFFADKNYILNTSPREGCPVSVLQGMACGLEPLVYNWVGADLITENIWKSAQDLSSIITAEVDFEKNRMKVEQEFNFVNKVQEITTLIDNLIEEK